MPELQEDDAAFGMHGVSDLTPAGDLLLRIDARCVRVALAFLHHLRGLGDDQSAFGRALRVIFGIERPCSERCLLWRACASAAPSRRGG